MFTIGDIVVYSSQGVCRITEISSREMGGKKIDYFILKPVYDERSTVSVPKDNERLLGRMRPVTTPAQAQALLDSIAAADDLWIDDDNRRREAFNNVLTEGKLDRICALFKTLVLRRQQLELLSRKLRTADEGFLRQAEKLICCECNYVGCGDPRDIREALLRDLL